MLHVETILNFYEGIELSTGISLRRRFQYS